MPKVQEKPREIIVKVVLDKNGKTMMKNKTGSIFGEVTLPKEIVAAIKKQGHLHFTAQFNKAGAIELLDVTDRMDW